MSIVPEYNHQRMAIEKRKQELESLLEEIRIAVMEFGLQHFKMTGKDLSAREAFNTMVLGFSNANLPKDFDQKWFEVENFKLK